MADVDIAVDSGDLKAAIQMLNDYGMSFTKMVNQVQTDSNRLSRASKATSDEVRQAFDRMIKSADDNRITEATRKQEAALKQYGSAFKNILNDNTKAAREEAKQVSASIKEQENTLRQFGSTFKGILGENARVAKESSQQIIAAKKQEEDVLRAFGGTFQNLIKEQTAAAREQVQALQKQGQAFRELIAEKERLTKAYNPLLAAEQTYLRMQAEINRAAQVGVVTAKQQEAALQQLKKEYDALGTGVYLAGSRFNQFGEMAGVTGKSAQRVGMYAQQAGYQFGDFAVQIQSGTNAGVAFSQQAAQLAGLIPGLAGALTTFAAIGIGLVIQNLTRGQKEAKDTYAQLSAFEDLEAVFQSVGTSFETSMVQSISRVRQEYGDFIADVAKFTLQKEMDTLKANLGTVMDKASSFNPNANQGFFSRTMSAMTQMGPGGGAFAAQGMEEANKYNDMLEQVADAQERLFNGSINSKSELVTAYKEVYEVMQNIPGITQEILDRFAEVGKESGIAVEAQKQIGESITGIAEKQREAFELYRETNNELRLSNELAAIRQKFGENSIQYLDAEKAQQLKILETELRREGVGQSLIDKLLVLKAEQIDYEQYVQRTDVTLQGVLSTLLSIAGVDISGVFSRAQSAAAGLLATVNAVGRGMSQLGALGLEAQALKAQSDAIASGKTPGEARVEADTVRFGNSLSGVPEFLKPIMGNVYRNQQLENLKYNEEIATGTKAFNDAAKGGGGKKKKGGGKSDAEKAADKLEKHEEKVGKAFVEFMEEHALYIEQQERLSGVFGEQRELLNKVIEIEKQLGDGRALASQEQIQAWAEQELALERKLEREQHIYDLGSQSVEDLLMTIVNGTGSIEDAFKSMLANIISEVYQQYVAKGAADVAGNFILSLFSAKGNAFGAGGVKMFAKGGVVDSPTAFNYSGGLGVMGEAGPEAIMPLKRNSQGRLGVEVSGGSGSGEVNIIQHFNFSANGDESVKQIIKQQMPEIENRAKNAVIAAKRRGEKGLQ